MKLQKPILHGRDHLPGGADPVGPWDSTEDVGLLSGVRSNLLTETPDVTAPAPDGDILTATGDGGSKWAANPAALLAGTPGQVILATRPGVYYRLNETTGPWIDMTSAHRDATYVSQPGTTRGDHDSPLDESDGATNVTCDGGDPGPVHDPTTIGYCVDDVFDVGGRQPFTVSAYINPSYPPDDVWSAGICGTVNLDVAPFSTIGFGLYVRSTTAPASRPVISFRRRTATTNDAITFDAIDVLPTVLGWYRLTGVYDGNTMTLYYDYLEVGETSSTGLMPTGNTRFRFGDCGIGEGIGGTNAPYTGGLDSLIFWDRPLSPGEVSAIARSGGGEKDLVYVTDGDGNMVLSKQKIEVEY